MATLSYSTLLLQLLCFIKWTQLYTTTSSSSKCSTIGVHPNECNRYDSNVDPYFYCGGSKDKKIPMKYVNDDYCDCVHTGDDEPGTSACNHGKFWCINNGYRGKYIYSSLVNDGLCDCCDGSDEINNPRIKCQNVCNEKSKEELQDFIAQKKKYMDGIKVKNSLLQVAKSKLNEKYSKKEQILKDLESKKSELKEKETLKKIAEDKENNYKEEKKERQETEKAQKEAERKAKCEAEGGTNCDDPNAQNENENENENNNEQTDSESDSGRDSDSDSDSGTDSQDPPSDESPREKRRRERRERRERNKERRERRNAMREQEAKERMEQIKQEYETPEDSDAPKEVPPEPEPIEHTPDEEFPYPEEYRPHEHTPDEEFPYPEEYRPHTEGDVAGDGGNDGDGDGDDGFDWSEFDEDEMEDYDEIPPIEEEEVEEDPMEDELRDKARDARNTYNDVNREITRLEDDLKDIDRVLEMDFGEKNIYASLFDECYSTKISKYDYEFCPFVSAQQKEGSSSTDLGKFKSFNYNEKGELVMAFDEGQKCWNGPKRSAYILFKCDTEHKIIDVLEPSTCKYTMTFNTPLACQQKELDQFTELINNQFKTEL